MNKTLNINLGGYPFTIDEGPYDLLEKYMRSIKSHFEHSDGYQEIITDIETRLAELIHEKLNGKPIVGLEEVTYAINIMGKPEDFGAEGSEDFEQEIGGKNNVNSEKYTTGKKLYRNPKDKRIAGVCSGIALYFGIENANWVRLIFIILFISYGFAIPLYILLWIFVPEAKTSNDFLKMKGQNASVNNIAEFVESGIDNLGQKLDQNEHYHTAKNYFNSGKLGDDLERGIKGFFRIIRPMLKILILLCIIPVFLFFFFFISAFAANLDTLNLFTSTNPWIGNLSILNGFAVVAVPLIALVLLIARILFKSRTPNGIKTGLGIFWGINLFSLITLTGVTSKEYATKSDINQTVAIPTLKADQIHLDLIDQNSESSGFFSMFNNMDNDLKNIPTRINIQPAINGQFYYTLVTSARGENASEAKKNASCLTFDPTVINDSTIHFPKKIQMKNNCKFRDQQAALNFFIPIGKRIIFDHDEFIWYLKDVKKDEKQFPGEFKLIKGNIYEMTADGLKCLNCSEEDLSEIIDPEEIIYDADNIYDRNILLKKVSSFNIPDPKNLTISFDKIMAISKNKYYSNEIKLNILKSSSKQFYSQMTMSYYSNANDTVQNFTNNYKYILSENELIFSNKININSAEKPQNLLLKINLYIPEGTILQFDDSVNEYVDQVDFNKKEISGNWTFLKKERLEMTAEGLKCINCDND